MIDITFIVPCLNSEETIAGTLNSVLSQQTSYKFEVIVVDNGSKDKTLEVINLYQDKVTLLHEEKSGANHARNLGIKNGKGKYFAFVDSDVILHKSWTQQLLTYMLNGNLLAAQGQVILSGHTNTLLNRYRASFAKNEAAISWISLVTSDFGIGHINTAACIYQAKALRSVRGFSSSIRIHEDVDLSYKVRSLPNGVIGATQKAVAYCFYTGNFFSYCKRALVYGYHSSLIKKKWNIRGFIVSSFSPQSRGVYIAIDFILFVFSLIGRTVGAVIHSIYLPLKLKEEKSNMERILSLSNGQSVKVLFENRELVNIKFQGSRI